jgi:PAS domain-containing protein
MVDEHSSKPNPDAIVERMSGPLEAMAHKGSLMPVLRPWKDILLPDEMAAEMLTRDGRFQIMVQFMRIMPVAALVIDDTSRIVFLNAAAERYWRVRLWDVRGKTLGEIMKMDQHEKRILSNEHANVLEPSCRGGAQVFFEHFRNGSERMSMLKFPFTEDENFRLIGCFVLPSNPSGDPKFGY